MKPIEQAIAAHQAGNLTQAEVLYRQILESNPRDFDALHMLGIIHAQREEYHEAERLLRRAVAIDNRVPPCLQNYGNILSKLHRFDEAVPIYNQALALAPNHAPFYSDRGNALKELGRYQEALTSFDRAIALMPNYAEAYYNRGLVLLKMERDDEALLSHERAIALKPNYALAHCGRGDVLRNQGRLADAEAAYLKSIAVDPNDGVLYFGLATSKTFRPGDPQLAAMESLAANATGMSKYSRMHLDFALAKAYDDIKDYRRSMQHLLAGNAAKRATIDYDEQAQFELFERIARVFSVELIAAKSGAGEPSRRPIFVLGMPRSGTTLIEQVLASHPAVYGANEVTILQDVAGNGSGRGNVVYPESVPGLGADQLQAIGRAYVERLATMAPSAERITDKTPINFLFIGLIHLALPNAIIIHSKRYPVDTCFSCFSKLFDMQSHTYDLGEIGRYYVRYQYLMQHWHRVLPPGRILDVHYEEMVGDLEGQVRRILDHCGLAWDDRCLDFHQTKRLVHTSSAAQVREPIYDSAVGRGRNYEPFLGPLLSALGDSTSKRV